MVFAGWSQCFRLVVLGWYRQLKATTEEVWRSRVFGIILVISLAPLGAYWWFVHVPSPGYAVAVLGAIGATMALRAEMGGVEKFFWLGVLTAFLLLELRAIDKDRAIHESEQAQARSDQTKQFKEIAGGIRTMVENSQGQFNATMSSLDENLKTATGGDSFCYLTLTMNAAEPSAIIVAVHEGHYPLRDVVARFVDQDKYSGENPASAKMTVEEITAGDATFNIGNLSEHAVGMVGRYSLAARDHWNFFVQFSGLNGFWQELIRLRKVDGKWAQAIKVSRYMVYKKNEPAWKKPMMKKLTPRSHE